MHFANQDHCLNCHTDITGKHCTNCGQQKVERVSFAQLIRAFQRVFIQFESPFIQLFIGLTISPAKTCREYLYGKRIKYANPIRYTFWLVTALLVVSTWQNITVFGPVLAQMEQELQDNFDSVSGALQNGLVYLFFVMPIASAFVTKLFFRRFAYSIAEFYVVHLLVQAHLTLLSIIAILVGFYSHPIFIMGLIIVTILYTCLVLSRLFVPITLANSIRGIMAGLASIMVNSLLLQFIIGVVSGFLHNPTQ